MDGLAVRDRKTLPSTADCGLAHGPNDDGVCEWDAQRLPDGQTVWCSPACERAFREAHVWNAARLAALRRHARRCEVCGNRPVQVHHAEPVDDYTPGCQHHPANLHVLCPDHHRHEHRHLRAKPGTQLDLFIAA